jgi:hypothetical protein
MHRLEKSVQGVRQFNRNQIHCFHNLSRVWNDKPFTRSYELGQPRELSSIVPLGPPNQRHRIVPGDKWLSWGARLRSQFGGR